uniref:RNA helicase n=1 Tax=Trichuris muris TaxID=70415 RepID=A0A5S6R3E2_TRIMR
MTCHVQNVALDKPADLCSVMVRPGDSSRETEQALPVYNFHFVQNILRSGIEDRDVGILSVCSEEALGLYGIYNYPYQSPSYIQGAVIPAILEEPQKDIVVQSQNGTGKTAAFAVSILQKIDVGRACPQCLCLTPTYELAVQVAMVIQKLGAFLSGLRVAMAVRDDDDRTFRNKDPITDHVIVGTPGTVLRWSASRLNYSSMALFVVDEADEMINTSSLGGQTTSISSFLPRSCQKLFFSATLDDMTLSFVRIISRHPTVFRLREEELTLRHVYQFYIRCANDVDKFDAIVDVYGSMIIGQCMIFCRTRRGAHELWCRMNNLGHAVCLLTAELSVAERANRIRSFRNGTTRVLIVTNVCARGIDVPYVNLVVNYDVPMLSDGSADFKSYLHRIGRSGRFGMSGVALTFVQSESEVRLVRDIGNHFGKPIEYLRRDKLKDIDELVEPDI